MAVSQLPGHCLMKGRQLTCADCSYITNYPNALQVHRLKEHVRDEVQNKPFKCTVCTYQTSFRSNLQKHQRVHTGERPYVCCCCFMRFSFRSNHKRHEQRCLATRGVHCPDPSCRFVSSQYSNLTTHIQASHAQTPTLTSSSFSTGQHQRLDLPLHAPEHKPCPHPIDNNGAANLKLTLNQFTLGQDQAQQAMIDLYYKSLTSAAVPSFHSLDHPHLMSAPLSLFSTQTDDSRVINDINNVKIEEEPGISASVGCHRSRNLSRKQSHPRRTLNNLNIEISDESTEEDSKFLMSDLPDIVMKQKKVFGKSMSSMSVNPEECERPTKLDMDAKPQITNIKTEPCDEAPMPVKKIKLEETNATHSYCSTSTNSTTSMTSLTSVTPMSEVAEIDSGCSLPFTLDAVLGDVSLEQLIDVLVQNGRLYRCQHCKILFEEYATYVLHMGCHGNMNPFSCHFCGAAFHEKFGFLTHFMKCVGK